MDYLLKFIVDYFDFIVLVLFLIASAFLLFVDCSEYKKSNLRKEYNFSKFIGYFYIAFGFTMYIVAGFIRM